MLDTSRKRYDHDDNFMAAWRRQQNRLGGSEADPPADSRFSPMRNRGLANRVRSILNEARNSGGRAGK